MPDYVQLRNPKTGLYVKIDKEVGRIVSHKKSPGPYKGVPIADEEKCMEEENELDKIIEETVDEVMEEHKEEIDAFLDDMAEEIINGIRTTDELEEEEEIETTVENTNHVNSHLSSSPWGIRTGTYKTFFDFTYPCEHGGGHCVECYNKEKYGK